MLTVAHRLRSEVGTQCIRLCYISYYSVLHNAILYYILLYHTIFVYVLLYIIILHQVILYIISSYIL